jgi:hypothetical protein
MNGTTPLPLRKLRAEMVMKDLDLKDVSDLSGVGYTQCSQILKGRLIHPEWLGKIREAIKDAPMPREVAAA